MAPRTLEGANVTHGIRATYVMYGCRCDLCRAANTASQARLNAVRAERLARGDLTVELVHGSHNAYQNYGCRCDLCVAGNSARCRDYRRSRRGAS